MPSVSMRNFTQDIDRDRIPRSGPPDQHGSPEQARMARMPGQRPIGVLERMLAAALDAPGGPRAGEHLLAAVSGGPDSTALLAGLAALGPARGLGLTAAYVDHGLRGTEGALECGRVAKLAEQLGVGFVSRTVAVVPGPGQEARARHARYVALVDMAGEVGAARS